MKLKNKKTGEILEKREDEQIIIPLIDDEGDWYEEGFNSLNELNEEWEDYEEPKEFWWINYNGGISHAEIGTMDRTAIKQIGNYFSSREEAEKAVEKLKAVKRLKDKGFRFDNWKNDNKKCLGDFVIFSHIKDLTDIIVDLDLLFGGGE